jgi:hypothetical protein
MDPIRLTLNTIQNQSLLVTVPSTVLVTGCLVTLNIVSKSATTKIIQRFPEFARLALEELVPYRETFTHEFDEYLAALELFRQLLADRKGDEPLPPKLFAPRYQRVIQTANDFKKVLLQDERLSSQKVAPHITKWTNLVIMACAEHYSPGISKKTK